MSGDGARGRPRDGEVTERLLREAETILGEQGLSTLNVVRLAARAGAGKATIYRRWPDKEVLAAGILSNASLVPQLGSGRSLREDFRALLMPWTLELSGAEKAAAALLSSCRHSQSIRSEMIASMLQPLDAAVRSALARHGVGERQLSTARLLAVVRGLWWERYLFSELPLTGAEVDDVVDHVLLALIHHDDAAPADPRG